MDSQHSDHDDAHGEAHTVHLPDPSAWPFIVGIAALVLGAALIFWARTDNSFSGPLLGAAVVIVLVAAGGWAYEDARMRRKAEEGHGAEPRDPRYSQVIAFAIAEGQLDAARAKGGVLGAIDSSDLRDLEGFEDLRISISPASDGPSQVLVGTTWRGREGLATYESTRETLLDTLTAHPDEVMPGTVQVFDMEVLRDTKDTSFRFSLGAATTVIAGLLVGGFALGGALTLFESDAEAGGGENGGPPVPADPYEVTARDNNFQPTTVAAPPDTEVTFTLVNRGLSNHNLSFYPDEGSADTQSNEFVKGEILAGGETEDISFASPGPGTYVFQCDLHPDQMRGVFEVRDDAPPPGGAETPAEGETPANALEITARDFLFQPTTVAAQPNTEVTFTFVNEGATPHNLSFYSDADAASSQSNEFVKGGNLPAGESEEVTFTTPGPGTYVFQCDIHPDQMQGTLEVRDDAP